jgi:hypothetical protein
MPSGQEDFSVRVTYRPLPTWPYPTTPAWERRSRFTFKASWSDTLALLEYEVDRLDGHNIVIGAGFREGDIRLDGMPRANAAQPSHPGIELSFDSKFGRLTYSTDVCDYWQHNVRAIALGLEALRAVDRHGISKRGQQYAGFAQLTAGGPDAERGKALVERAGGMRAALMRHHPDHNGDPRDFADVQAYRQQVGA